MPACAGTVARLCRCTGWRWWYPQPLEHTADRRGSHAVAEFEQFALNSLVSPAGILPGHALDQRAHTVIDGWTTAVGVGPLVGHQATVPAQDCARCDQSMDPQHFGQGSDQRGEHRSIRPVHSGLGVGSAQHGDFVTQHQQLDVLRRRGAAE